MIRTNLSTRAFYNERAVHFWLLVVAAVVLLATAFNVSRVLRYSRSDTELAARASRDEARAGDLRQQAARLRATVDPKQVEFASSEARQANELIDRRTFSWTELLNRLEKTQPDEVRLVAVRPRLERDGTIVLTMNVVSKDVGDVDMFMEKLEETGAFANLRPVVEQVNDEGLVETMLESIYVPSSAKADDKETAKPEEKTSEEKETATPEEKEKPAPAGARPPR